jgi:hydroxymethylbilane synthase
LCIAAVSDREDAAELLVIQKSQFSSKLLWELNLNASIGTSSARRKSLVMAHRSDLEIRELRGNVPTRIQKLRDGQYDAILLAKAGVSRLAIDLSEFHVVELNPKIVVPAPAQGVLALQVRENETELFQEIQKLNNPWVEKQISIERKVLNLMEGGCQLPLGVYCDTENVYVSYAKQWEMGSKYYVFSYSEKEGLAEEIVSFLKTN